ncbi:hypothetical protein, partial [Bordetella holmesii]|uniref:hypothetical protein n=1 Tax=Bordetella holmesii TaxID=35814 RepID=UPI001A9A2488
GGLQAARQNIGRRRARVVQGRVQQGTLSLSQQAAGQSGAGLCDRLQQATVAGPPGRECANRSGGGLGPFGQRIRIDA